MSLKRRRAASTRRTYLLAMLSFGREQPNELGNLLAMLKPICKHPECKRFGLSERFGACGAVGHHPRQRDDLGDPPTVRFQFRRDRQYDLYFNRRRRIPLSLAMRNAPVRSMA